MINRKFIIYLLIIMCIVVLSYLYKKEKLSRCYNYSPTVKHCFTVFEKEFWQKNKYKSVPGLIPLLPY